MLTFLEAQWDIPFFYTHPLPLSMEGPLNAFFKGTELGGTGKIKWNVPIKIAFNEAYMYSI